MAYKLVFLPSAKTDADEIDSYLSENAPSKASRFVIKLKEHLTLIKKMPLMYRIYEDFPLYRAAPVLDYLMFYTVNDKTSTIEIHRILWSGMDIPKYLA